MDYMLEPLELPFPPSLNSYYRYIKMGNSCRVLISKEGREYKKIVKEIIDGLPKKIKMLEGRLVVVVSLHAPTRRKYDLDNRCKALFDSLEEAEVFLNDEQIDHLTIRRGEYFKNDGKALIQIIELGEDENENSEDES